jgi:hypothetical protein
MVNLNWQRMARIARRSAQQRRRTLFLPYGAPVEEAARISTEELKRLHGTPIVGRASGCCQPRDLPRRTDMLPGPKCTHLRAALDQGPAARPADRGVLHLRVSDQRQNRERAATPGVRCASGGGGITACTIGGPTVPMDLSTYEELPNIKQQSREKESAPK